MNFLNLESFVLTPSSDGKFMLHELEDVTNFQKNSFVIIPYSNPQKEKIKPQFFSIKNKTEIKIEKKSLGLPQITMLSEISKEKYIQKVNAIKQHIQFGNVYEMNYCIQFFAKEIETDVVQVFLNLIEIAQAPYSYLVKIKDDFIICASPELFLKRENQNLITKPIKGTIKRGVNTEEDEQLKLQLFNSKKERTENVMAVDVARNDLSILAKRGSVNVNKLYNIESYKTVHQMVSTVKCEIEGQISFNEILEATFPMASMTGAPKQSAMNLIDEFEIFNRHYYSGAMGFVDENENFEMCVIIRSIFYNQKNKTLSIAAGGAITYLSETEKEFDECLLKAKGMMSALNASILF